MEEIEGYKKIIDNIDIVMERIEKNKYILLFSIENQTINLKNLINFDLTSILYEINRNIFDNFQRHEIDQNNIECFFLIKHFFADFGLAQKYVHLNIEKVDDNAICFLCKNSETFFLEAPQNAEQLVIEYMSIVCKMRDDHVSEIKTTIFFSDELDLPAFVEKFAGIIISKIFVKIKQFIESYRNI